MTKNSFILLALAGAALAGCAEGQFPADSRWAARQQPTADAAASPAVAATTAPVARPATLGAGGAAPEALDQASATERAEATAATATPAAGESRLGTTIASLGNPTDAGFWIKSPLVKAAGKGKIVDPATGKAVNVNLIPMPGDAGAGSQVSLSAMRELGVNLTALPEIEVWKL
ncbi:hypothetical protein ACEYYB_02315 [Paracoccus sp. p4-l81]|uniref:hypothetical protein n=1 Tax=unclassified Paracoccus (in: a-proteobacteria) TaxID=2688777 RepID=UPI0035BB718A